MSIQSIITSLKPQRVHLYSQGWFSQPPTNHIGVGYSSDDSSVIFRQVISAKEVFAPALLSTVADWYGPNQQLNNNYCLQLRAVSETLGTQFGICIDHGASGVNTLSGLYDLMAYIRSRYFTSPAYVKTNTGKFMLWNFGLETIAGLDLVTFQNANPDLILLTENKGQYSYAWPNGFSTDYPQAYLKRYLARNDSFMIPALWRLFDDHKVSNPSESAWGGPARLMTAGATGWELWNSLAIEIVSSGKQFTDIGIATLDDYEEGTRLEPWILQEYGALVSAQGRILQAVNTRKDQG